MVDSEYLNVKRFVRQRLTDDIGQGTRVRGGGAEEHTGRGGPRCMQIGIVEKPLFHVIALPHVRSTA